MPDRFALKHPNPIFALALSLMRASEDVMQSVNNIRRDGATGAASYRKELLQRQWGSYKSIGGTAATPEQVRMPQDPCNDSKMAFERKSAEVQAQQRDCTASHPTEMKLSALSRDLVSGRGYLAALEKIRDEKRGNPNVDPGLKGSAHGNNSATNARLIKQKLEGLRG